MNKLLTVEEARRAILDHGKALSAERVVITDAVGRYLAEDVEAPSDVPAFDNSAMDGYALRHGDRGHRTIVGESAAGNPFDGTVEPGQAVRIMTGAAVPAGADTVVMREVCEVSQDRLEVTEVIEPGSHIRRRGEFLERGRVALSAGARVSASDVGLLASFGRTVVYAGRRARVGIVATGSELCEPDRAPGAGQIVNSNAYMLEAMVRESGGVPTVAPIVPDDRSATLQTISSLASHCDLLLTIGGVSVGDYDYVRDVLEELSEGIEFWKIRMKPGKPLAFGVIAGRTPAIGLPGNPVSSFVSFHQFVRPLLATMHGAPPDSVSPTRRTLVAGEVIQSTERRHHFVVGRVTDGEFHSHGAQSSGNLILMHGATAFGIVPEGVARIERGAPIDVESF